MTKPTLRRNRERRRLRFFEPLEDRRLMALAPFEHGDIGYIPDANTPRIQRYDVAHEA